MKRKTYYRIVLVGLYAIGLVALWFAIGWVGIVGIALWLAAWTIEKTS